MKFAHMSDFHFTFHAEKYGFIRKDVVETATKTINDLKAIESEVDFLVITGDLTEAGDIESYIGLKKLLDNLTIPFFVVPGNHDKRNAFQEVFGTSHHRNVGNKLDFEVRFKDLQLLGFDSLIEGESAGSLEVEQLLRLEHCLSDESYGYTVIAVHHPPFLTGHMEFDQLSKVTGSDHMAKIIEGSKSKVIILAGHVHRPYQAHWHGANCYISGGPSFQMGSHFCFGESPLGVVCEPYSYFIHSIDSSGYHSVGTKYVDIGKNHSCNVSAIDANSWA